MRHMKISSLLSSKAAEFVSLWDVITELSIKESIKKSRAATGLIALLEDDEIMQTNWYFVERDKDTLIVIGACDHEYGMSSQHCGLELLREIAKSVNIEEDIADFCLFHSGWMKDEIAGIFKLKSLDPLSCFDDTHISSGAIVETSPSGTLIFVDDAIDLYTEKGDPQGRKILLHEIINACEKGSISYRRSDGLSEDVAPMVLYQNGILQLERSSLDLWINDFGYLRFTHTKGTSNNQSQSEVKPDWVQYAKFPYLTTNECACLLEGVDPSLYEIPTVDEYGDLESTESKISAPIIKRVQATCQIIERSANNGLSALTSQRQKVNGLYQYSFYTNNFVEWANGLGYQLDRKFLDEYQLLNTSPVINTQPTVEKEDYLDVNHPCYSPKLVAAIKAWEYAVTKHGTGQTKPNDNITNWLNKNKESLGFELTKSALEQVTYVANFRTDTGSIKKEKVPEHALEIEIYNNNKKKKSNLKVSDDFIFDEEKLF